jgi:hypothetical protein
MVTGRAAEAAAAHLAALGRDRDAAAAHLEALGELAGALANRIAAAPGPGDLARILAAARPR